jgi:hypothetical protein
LSALVAHFLFGFALGSKAAWLPTLAGWVSGDEFEAHGRRAFHRLASRIPRLSTALETGAAPTAIEILSDGVGIFDRRDAPQDKYPHRKFG